MGKRRVSIVPHTHWDREWYSPFQTFRLRLVDLLDDLLPRLDADPSYAHFMLDGQMAVIEEYLVQGYGNGARLPDDAKALVAAVTDFEADWESFLVGPILWMNGTDHLMPRPWLGRVVSEANAIQDDVELVVTSLSDHLAHAT